MARYEQWILPEHPFKEDFKENSTLNIVEEGTGIQNTTSPKGEIYNIKKEKEMSDKITIEIDKDVFAQQAKVKKEKPAKIICKVDGELIEFKNEDKLKAFMWTERPKEVIRYNISGTVSVPFDLTTTPIK